MKTTRPVSSLLILLSAFVLFSTSSFAQDATGRILGTVTDQNGALVVGANVAVTNTGTNVVTNVTTDTQGFFQAFPLPIGTYKISVKKQGFKSAISDENKLLINQNLRVDIKLTVGGGTETIDVSANAAGVETVTATLGNSVTDRPLVDMPLNGRNPMQLALLQPGVTESNIGGSGGGSGFSVAGGRPDSVTYLLDGGVNNNLLSNGIVYNPNPDTIQEFKIITSNYTAEYGRNGGGVVSVVTKSGTNQFHGSMFEFLRNRALNANSFFNNFNGKPRDDLKRNQYGGTFGGPVRFPHFDGRDKFFFFVGYEGQRLTQGVTLDNPPQTFTPRELIGDFSRSNSLPIGDPANFCGSPIGGPDCNVQQFLQNNPFYQSNAALAAQAVIDPTKIDPTAKKFIAAGLIPTSPTGFLNDQASGSDNFDELTGKFDINFSQKDKFSVTLGGQRESALVPFSSNTSSLYPITNAGHRYFSSFGETHIFTSNLLNEAHVTVQRIHTLQFKPAATLPSPSALGVATTPDLVNGPPRLEFLTSGLTLGFSPQGPQDIINNTFTYSDNVSWTKGRHNWKFGGYFSAYQNNTVYDFYGSGDFFFYGSFGSFSGTDRADFLFGNPDEYLQFGNAPSNIRSKATYGFAQDEWHIRRNLVLTLGVRYEYSTPKTDTKGRSFSLAKGVQSTVFTNAPTGVLFPGDANAPNGANFPDKNDWAPRIGFAWDPWGDGKTSIRGGAGLFYDILKGEDNLQFNGQAPFFGYSDLFFDPVGPGVSGPSGYFNTPYATNTFGTPNSFPSKPPAKNIDFNAAGFLPFAGGGVYFVDPHLRTPYTYQYNLSIEHALANKMTLEAAYVGSLSRKMTLLEDTNPFVLGTMTRTFNTVPGASFNRLYTFRNIGNAEYNSLELSLNKTLSDTKLIGKTYFTLAYTYAHNIDNGSGFRNRNSQEPFYNSNQFRASSDFDIRHRIVFSGGWDLPFDHAWQNGPKRLTQGWSLYPILSWRTGFPLDIFGPFQPSNSSTGPSAAGDQDLARVNVTGPITFFDPHINQTFTLPSSCAGGSATGFFWFNPTVFNCNYPSNAAALANAALRTYGSLPRNAFRGPGRTNMDLSVAKVTKVFENLNMEIRADFFNIFNHAEFANPDTGSQSPHFGQITSVYTNSERIIQFAVKIKF